MPARTLLLSKSCWRETLPGRSALNRSFAILTFFSFLTTMLTGLPRCGAARFKVAGSASLWRTPTNGSKGISACLVSKVSHVIPFYFSFLVGGEKICSGLFPLGSSTFPGTYEGRQCFGSPLQKRWSLLHDLRQRTAVIWTKLWIDMCWEKMLACCFSYAMTCTWD